MKKIQRLIASSLLGILSGCTSLPSTSPNRVEQNVPQMINYRYADNAQSYFNAFPENIPGASAIRKFPTAKAKHNLVHILQLHLADNLSAQEINTILETQENIHKVISYLSDHHLAPRVYLEGITQEEAVEIYEVKPLLMSEKGSRYMSGAEQAFLEGKIEISAGEDEQAHYQAVQLAKKILKFEKEIEDAASTDAPILPLIREKLEFIKDPQTIKVLCEDREDIVLRYIVSNKDTNAIVVYGGAHAWGGRISGGNSYPQDDRSSVKDNIASWNIRYPHNKFSLIEVVTYDKVRIAK